MATNVTNIIELRGKPERIQKLLEVDKIIPMPGNLYMGDVSRDGPKPYGKNNWLDWSRANWGPQWDAYGFDNRPKDTPANTLWFLSANQPPHPVIQRLSEMFPGVAMEHLWADSNLVYGCGNRTYKQVRRSKNATRTMSAMPMPMCSCLECSMLLTGI